MMDRRRSWWSLQRKSTVIVLSASYDGSILLTRGVVQRENDKGNGGQDGTQRSIIDAERKARSIAVESVVNL